MLKKLAEQVNTLIRTVSLNQLPGITEEGRRAILERLEDIKRILQMARGD